MSGRGTSNKNQMPNSKHRKVLRQHCIDRDGDGTRVACSFNCGRMLTLAEITLDRFPLTGINGGTYRKDNVRAACGHCNSSDGSKSMHARLGHKLRAAIS